MRLILKTNDPVQLDYAQAVLRDAGIGAVVFDGAMSVMEGSVGVLPRRLMVADEDEAEARAILTEALGAKALEPEA
ncbi:hypothetical protein FHS83_003465 [Rhizomicrobium palustre]|uniref:DUF2007 domain-containing protein n=1 Tax=Rhizomicrobium palustre TaxID=189966 RepID=A0A846N4Z7_9PROT|nr:DUF2007 domain-containing protein [Rhizomicrobium palustre]NIK90147.1 hypothetical protein [Rhizomicrobium palustre]